MNLTAAALRRIAVVVQAAAVGGLAAALAAGADWSWPAA
ncbi:MAG TPA: acetyltransferase, partial [Cupriavidus sp.]|nr:acetyltransferase [Cupriavidus sp.]